MRAGSIGGRKITFIYDDDAVNPAKIVAQVPRLIESGEVAFPFSTLGTEAYFGRAASSQMRASRQRRYPPFRYRNRSSSNYGIATCR
jgi:hypothetical protein